MECLAKPSLACLTDKEVSRILEKNPLRPITKRSITTRKALREGLETIREQGFAMERGEVIDGAGGKGRVRELIENVCETAKKISVGAGHKEE